LQAGEYWTANFDGADYYYVSKVKIKNRGAFGERLALARVEISGQLCGSLPSPTADGEWYEVTCATSLKGTAVKVVTTQN
jgi:hypothetical protein